MLGEHGQGLLGLGVLDIRAIEDVDELCAFLSGACCHVGQQTLQIRGGVQQSAVVQTQEIAFLDLAAVKVGIAGSVGNLHGGDAAQSLGHGSGVGGFIHVGIKAQHGGDALGYGLGGDHDDLFVGQTGGLLSSHDNILVVGQNEDHLGGSTLNLLQNIFRGGIHGLAAFDDAVHTQIPEDGGKARAGADGDDTVLLLRRGHGGSVLGLQLGFGHVQVVGALGSAAGGHVLVLGAHVFDLGQLQNAVLLRFRQSGAGDVGMDMNLECVVVLANDQTVTDRIEISAEGVQISMFVFADNEHGVKGEGDIFVGQVGEIR